MAGEWISIDCCIATKPEILELIGETGEPAAVIVGRLTLFWAWASLNSGDGTVKGNAATLKAVAGGEEQFWRAVQRCGWISFGDGVIEIHGWDDRFSKAAKSRLLARRRLQKHRENAKNDPGNADETQERFRVQRTSVSGCNAPPLLDRGDRGDRREEIEEKREELIPAAPVPTSKPAKPVRSTAKPSLSWDSESGWQGITDTDRQEWATAFPGVILAQELAKANAWLKANPTKAHRSNWRRFIVGWFQRCQDKGGTDRQQTGRRPEDKPPPDVWKDRYREAPYRTPKESMELAATLRIKDEGSK